MPRKRREDIDDPPDLWTRYTTTRSDADRNALVTHYQALIDIVAGRVWKRLPPCVCYDDLASHAATGLIQAVERFDPTANVKFMSFASHRVTGAVYDGMRDDDHLPRHARQRLGTAHRAAESFYGEHGREPTEAELRPLLEKATASIANVDADSVTSSNRNYKPAENPLPLGQRVATGDRGILTLGETVEDENADLPDRLPIARDVYETATRTLPLKLRAVVESYYRLNMKMREIAADLHCSESRVSQMHSRAIALMRSRLTEEDLAWQ
jgi:RNA polymerase sigma factor for flagellar operon FliA